MRAYGLFSIAMCLPAAAARAQTAPAPPPWAPIHDSMSPQLAAAFIVLSLCGAIVAIVWLGLRHRREQAAMTHKTAVELAQRGLSMPPQLLTGTGVSRLYSDLRTGLVLMGLGVGAIVFALTLPHHPAWGLGLIPLFAGKGYILTWLLGKQSRSDHT